MSLRAIVLWLVVCGAVYAIIWTVMYDNMARTGFEPWHSVDKYLAWQEIKDDPVISAIGHWYSEEWSGSYPKLLVAKSKRIASLLPKGMSRSDWNAIMKENGFEVNSGNNQVCHSVRYNLIGRDITVCAYREVGPMNCRYYYEILSSFQDNRLVETNVYRTNSTCY